MVVSTINRTNDFYFHILQLCWNDKNIRNDRRYRQMVCGLRLKEAVDTQSLQISEKTGWFTSSRQNDLAKIGKIAGHFIRMFAYSIGEALFEDFDFDQHSSIPDEKFNEYVESLKVKKAIVPVVVKIKISKQSSFDPKRFICVSQDHINELSDGEEISASFRSKLITIKTEYHDWAWKLLNARTLDERTQRLNDIIPIREQTSGPIQVSSEDSSQNVHIRHNVTTSKRIKYPNKMYSSEIYEKF